GGGDLVARMAAPRFVVGVDLGTTNTACAWVDTHAGRTIRVFEVPQLVAPGEMGTRPTLPSFVYLAGAHDLPRGSLDLPWTPRRARRASPTSSSSRSRRPPSTPGSWRTSRNGGRAWRRIRSSS